MLQLIISCRYPTGLGTQAELAERAIEWSCLRYTTNNPGYSGRLPSSSFSRGGIDSDVRD